MFGQIWIGVAQFARSAPSGHIRRFFHENLLEGEGMPLPRKRLCQDFEQGSSINDLSMPRKSPGQ